MHAAAGLRGDRRETVQAAYSLAKPVRTAAEREPHMFYDAQETSHKATREVFSCRLCIAILSGEHSLASLTGANRAARDISQLRFSLSAPRR